MSAWGGRKGSGSRLRTGAPAFRAACGPSPGADQPRISFATHATQGSGRSRPTCAITARVRDGASPRPAQANAHATRTMSPPAFTRVTAAIGALGADAVRPRDSPGPATGVWHGPQVSGTASTTVVYGCRRG